MAVDLTSVKYTPPTGEEMTLSALGTKVNAGADLNTSEIVLGISATNAHIATQKGMSPGDMPAAKPVVPESVLGAIAEVTT